MTRLLLGVAVAAGVVVTGAPAANACADLAHCPGGTVVCRVVGCPAVCTAHPVPVLNHRVCAP